MKKLNDLVELVDNNDACVVLKVKEGSQLDMILLGCMNGDENMIRLAKDSEDTITIFHKDGSHYSWARNTVVVECMRVRRRMIERCVYDITGYATGYINTMRREGKL